MRFYDVESEFYDLFYFNDTRDIPLYRKFLCPKVLDVMTGTGRILYHLKPDYGVGLDIHEKMLAKANENLKGMKVKLVHEDARDFNLDEKFCLIIIGYNSIMMFPKEDREKILISSVRHLSEEGLIIVDTLNPFALVEDIVHYGDTVEKNGIYYSRFFVPRWKGDHWVITYFYDVVKDEIVRRKYASLNLYPVYLGDLQEEMKNASLCIKEIYGDYDFSDFDEEKSDRIIVVAQKCGEKQ